MTVKELKSIMQAAAMNNPFVTMESAYELGIDETYISISFAGNYAGQVRKLYMEGDRFILDGSFDMDDPTNTPDAETLLVMLETAPESAEVVYFVPSMGTFPVVSADRKMGDWGDGDGTFDMIDIKCTEEPVDEAIMDDFMASNYYKESVRKNRRVMHEADESEATSGFDKAELGAALNAASRKITPTRFFKMLKKAGMSDTDIYNFQEYLANEEQIFEEDYSETDLAMHGSEWLTILDDYESVEEEADNVKQVKKCWPNLREENIDLIAGWYDEEGGEFDKNDFMDMLWASSYDDNEVVALQQDLIDCGYYEEDDMPHNFTEEKVTLEDWCWNNRLDSVVADQFKKYLDKVRGLGDKDLTPEEFEELYIDFQRCKYKRY